LTEWGKVRKRNSLCEEIAIEVVLNITRSNLHINQFINLLFCNRIYFKNLLRYTQKKLFIWSFDGNV